MENSEAGLHGTFGFGVNEKYRVEGINDGANQLGLDFGEVGQSWYCELEFFFAVKALPCRGQGVRIAMFHFYHRLDFG